MTAVWQKLFIVFTGLFLSACAVGDKALSSLPGQDTLDRASFSADKMEAHIRFLADDLLQGRSFDSEGYRIAANYVASEFQQMGLKTLSGKGYFQEVPLHIARLDTANSYMTLTIDGKAQPLTLGKNYLLGTNMTGLPLSGAGEIVYVGYGVHAPSQGHDDFAGIDVKDKIILMLTGLPYGLSSEIEAHLSSAEQKAAALSALGVAGVLIVGTPEYEAGFPFDAAVEDMENPFVGWQPQQGDERFPANIPFAWLHHDVAQQLFDQMGQTIAEASTAAQAGQKQPKTLNATAEMVVKTEFQKQFSSPNVIGIIEGRDPDLRDEYVVMSAHLDHVSLWPDTDSQDRIRNGALDNAAGVAALLEAARVFAESPSKPRRSLIFIALTAEEPGLRGAGYYTYYPAVPIEQHVANVNLDMPLILYDFADVVAFGGERSSIGASAKAILDRVGIGLSPDPMPEQSFFIRSDHYRFVQQGVPSIFLIAGFAETADGENGGEIFRHFLATHYHKPSDDLSLPINYEAGAKFAYVNWLILNKIANDPRRPTWNKGDFFAELYDR